MRLIYALQCLFLLAGYAYAGLEDVKSTYTLTTNNFDSTIKGKNALVAFFAPWCGHCKSLAPVWEKLGNDFKDEESVIVGQLDADNQDNRGVAERYGVRGYPSIKFFPADGSPPQDYNSPRTEEAFVEFINSQAGTQRSVGGLLSELAGRIPTYDALISTFYTSSASARASLIEQFESFKATTFSTDPKKSSAANYYIKVLNKISTGSADWVVSEYERLSKILEKKGTMAGKQLEDLYTRRNILKAFQGYKDQAAEVVKDAGASVESVVGEIKASAASIVGGGQGEFNSASSSVSGQAVKSASSISGQASSVAGQASKSAQSIAGQAAKATDSAASILANAQAHAESLAASLMGDERASAASLSGAASSAASSVSGAAESVYADAQASASSVSGAAASVVSSVSKNVEQAAGTAYASAESAASQVSASIDSAASRASASASDVYHKVAGEL